MSQINVGIIGFGTVGAGTVEVLLENREAIRNRVGAEIAVKRIADLDVDTDRDVSVAQDLLTTEAMDVINDPDIQIAVELIGGIDKAKEYILKAMATGKHVITANKALLAEHGAELYDAAEKHRVSLAFEASVAGGIPVLRSLREGLSANRIKSLLGILNGTSNYILTEMTQKGHPYKQAILVSIAFGNPVPFDHIYQEGIDRLTPDDIRFAHEFGYCIKLLAIARHSENRIEARVHPSMIPLDHIMANVNGAYNAIYVEGDFVGPNLYYGLGAGRRPTGSAVVSDLIDLARRIREPSDNRMPPLGHVLPPREAPTIRPIESLRSAYYFRFSAIDRPGVLSKIAGILGEHQISIYSVIQKGRKVNGTVPIVMLTHEARESNVLKALSDMDAVDVLTDKTLMIRVEGS